jgi:hypothetical protein
MRPAVHIERAEDNGLVLTDINCIAYGFPLEAGRASLPQASLWQDALPGQGSRIRKAIEEAEVTEALSLLRVLTWSLSYRRNSPTALPRPVANAYPRTACAIPQRQSWQPHGKGFARNPGPPPP